MFYRHYDTGQELAPFVSQRISIAWATGLFRAGVSTPMFQPTPPPMEGLPENEEVVEQTLRKIVSDPRRYGFPTTVEMEDGLSPAPSLDYEGITIDSTVGGRGRASTIFRT
jgi:hypothetical protein